MSATTTIEIETETATATATEGDLFLQHRPLLFAIAYRMLGSVADAEDAVQETYLRWQRTLASGETIESPKAWLSAVVTRLCLDQLRSARVQREEYVGEWLPEPLLSAEEPDVADHAMLAESLSLAFLVLLERLTPTERAVFLLHDVFAFGFAEIAPIVGESEANCRQIAHRARQRVAAGRPRFDASPEEQERLASTFARAVTEGDVPALIATLADDITLWADGGGKVRAGQRPIRGADRVARGLLGFARQVQESIEVRPVRVNGQPGFVGIVGGKLSAVLALEIADGRIQGIRIIANPDKLRHISV